MIDLITLCAFFIGVVAKIMTKITPIGFQVLRNAFQAVFVILSILPFL
jgi:hypothetical protein